MKKLYLLIIIWLPAMSHSQDFVYDPTTSVHTECDGFTSATISMVTPDDSGITFAWETVENTLPSGWDYSLCDHTLCYTGIPASGTMDAISDAEMSAGTKGFLKITLNAFDIYGEGTARFYVYDQSDNTVGDTVTFTFNNADVSGLEESELSFSVYPNPANEVLTIDNEHNQQLSYGISDLSGKEILSGNISANSKANIDVSKLPVGIYFVTSLNESGDRRTEKLIIR